MPDQGAARSDELEVAEEFAGRGMLLANAGDLQGGLPLLRAAVERAERLAAGDASVELRLAVFRNDLGLTLAWLGRSAEAIALIAAAIATYRRQLAVAARPESESGTVRLLLANSLDSLGTRLASLGRHGEALRAAEESIAHYRIWAARREVAQLRELARALNNLSIRCADADRHEDALTASREAVALFRRTPPVDPDDLSGLTHATSNLTLRLARLDLHSEVPALADETLRLVARLPEPHPRSQLASLAESLTWLAWYLCKHGHPLRSRSVARAARSLRRRLTV